MKSLDEVLDERLEFCKSLKLAKSMGVSRTVAEKQLTIYEEKLTMRLLRMIPKLNDPPCPPERRLR